MAKIAVIIVTYNSSSMIGRVLDALQAQTLPPDRVLVIDNGSADADETARQVVAFAGIEWLPLHRNTGFAAANNRGIAMCSEADLIALLNPDAFPQPHWLEQMVRASEEYPCAGSFASRLLSHENEHVLDGAGDGFGLDGKPRRRGHGLDAGLHFTQPEEVFCASAAAAVYRRQALEQVAGFDEDYFCYLEDVDLGFRLQLAGYSCRYVPQAVVAHIGSATTGGQHGEFAVYHGHRNLVWTYIKNMPGVLFGLLLPFHLLLNLVTLVYFAVRGQAFILLKAKIDAVALIPEMWRKRKAIQSARLCSIGTIWRLLDKRILH
jgi:GT2 family glycosyltransferase